MGWSAANLPSVGRRPRGLPQMLALALGGALSVSSATAQMPPPTLDPDKIAMGAFYDGARVRIHGTAPSDSGVLVVIRGTEKDEFFNRKGRVGIIWLNADRIHIKQAPSVLLGFSSADVNSLLSRASLDDYQLDEVAVKKRICCFSHCKCPLTGGHARQSGSSDTQPDPAYAELLRTSFLELKESEGSYHWYPGAVTLAPLADPGTAYTLDVQWPRKAPPGAYRVEVYACRGGTVIARSAATLQLVEVGFPAYVAKLAFEHPWIYGSSAVLIAMFAGFGIDALTVRLRRRKRGPTGGSGHPLPGTRPAPSERKSTEAHDSEAVHRS